MGNVRVVTDSAGDLPPELAAELGVDVVPLTIRFGGEELVDGRDLSPAEFWKRCSASPVLPETAAPSAGAFRTVFEGAAAAGASGVACVTLSSKLSATYQAALTAAADLSGRVPVEVVDSRSITLGEGLITIATAEMARAGKDLGEIAAAARGLTGRSRVFGALDTLENLRKGGRIGPAAAVFGTILAFKPIISVEDGVIGGESRQRTRSKSLRYLAGKVAELGPLERIAVVHGDTPDVDELVELVRPLVGDLEVTVAQLGPVVGTHAGKGALGIAMLLPA